MVEPVVVISRSAAEPGWPLALVAGLPVVERNLMALRSIGVERAVLACGPAEYELLRGHFARRPPDPRLPRVDVDREQAGRGGRSGGWIIDGSFVYHPQRLRKVAESRSREVTESSTHGAAESGEDAGYREDVTTAAGRRRAARAILESLRKPTDGWFARTIDRSISLAISSWLAPLPVHPNAITVATLFVGLASGVLAARGTYLFFVMAGALFLLASVLDGVDGEIARMKFQGSDAGQWLDTVCDDVTNAVYLAGVTAGTWRAFASPWLLWTGVMAVGLDVVTVAFLYWQLVTRVNARTLLAFEETVLAPALAQPGLAGFVARLQPFLKRDLYAPLFLVFALAGAAWLALPGTAVALAVALVFLLRDFAAERAGARARLGPA
jgi:phosphatidylglycerophosphate synthase